jgi:hypothetical protein
VYVNFSGSALPNRRGSGVVLQSPCLGGLSLNLPQCDWLLGHWLQSPLSTLLEF